MASTIFAGSGSVTVTMTGGGSASALRYRNEAATSATTATAQAATATAQAAIATAAKVLAQQYAVDAALMSGITVIADATYTILAADNGKILYFTSATAVAVTVPSGLGAEFFCSLAQGGAGQITASAGVGVTLNNADSQYATQAQYVRLTLWAPVADTFILEGRTA